MFLTCLSNYGGELLVDWSSCFIQGRRIKTVFHYLQSLPRCKKVRSEAQFSFHSLASSSLTSPLSEISPFLSRLSGSVTEEKTQEAFICGKDNLVTLKRFYALLSYIKKALYISSNSLPIIGNDSFVSQT